MQKFKITVTATFAFTGDEEDADRHAEVARNMVEGILEDADVEADAELDENPREKGDDDGVEYADPRDARDERD